MSELTVGPNDALSAVHETVQNARRVRGKRLRKDSLARKIMFLAALFSGLLVVAIAVALYIRSQPLFAKQSLWQIVSGNVWRPPSLQFGLRPFILGTVWVTVVAIVLALPLALLTSIFLAEYARPRTRAIVKPLIDLLAGLPAVVYGVWGLIVVVPFIADKLGPYAAAHWGKVPFLHTEYTTGFCVLSAGFVLAIMILPFIISVTDEVLKSVPQDYRDAATALGATKLEVIWKVVLRRARPGVIAAVVLGVSRAFGETIAVLIVAGNVPEVPKSVFDPAYPLPALMANNYGEMMSIPLYDSAMLGSMLILLLIVIFFNVTARVVMTRSAKGVA